MRAAPALPVPAPLDTPNNMKGGILVVLPPGYGPAEDTPPSERSFFSDSAVDRGRALARFVSWFPVWGIPLATTRMTAGEFERSFFCCEWPASPVSGARGPQLVQKYSVKCAELAATIRSREPRLVIFLSCYLWQAANTDQGRVLLADALGAPQEPGRRISPVRLAAYAQRWEKAMVLALPLPGPNTTLQFVQSVGNAVQRAFREAAVLPETSSDPLIEQAAGCLVVDEEASIRRIRTELHVTEERARSLLESLQGRTIDKDDAGRLHVISGKPC